VARDGGAPLAQPADPLDERERRRDDRPCRVELDHDRHVLALPVLRLAGAAADPQRVVRDVHPGPMRDRASRRPTATG